jgi:transcriptional regulator with XRE-family HTH domain
MNAIAPRRIMVRGGPVAVDAHVGRQIRARRILVGLSQNELGNALGISFQQIQKFERGANRAAASRLYQLAGALGVEPAYFFEGLQAAAAPLTSAPDLIDKDTAELLRAFQAISRPAVRTSILNIVLAAASAKTDYTAEVVL